MLSHSESVSIDASTTDDGFAFGATPKLTTTLKRLVRSYPKDIGIIKEFIQNADDAGAQCVIIVMDWRSHPCKKLPDPKMQALMGPALLIFNDAVFSDDDIKSIQNIGESVKQVDTSKIGRFGLGFNATYNVTDYPSLLTRQFVLFFDPHLNVIPGADYKTPGHGWDLTVKKVKVWEAYKDMLIPFQVMDSMFVEGQDYFDGTLFRLPLRTEETYQDSQIKQEPFTKGDFNFILDQLKKVGAELLLFLKNVTQITVSEISPGCDQPDLLLTISTDNQSAVLENRRQINEAISDKPERLLEKLRSGDHELPKKIFTHYISVKYEGCVEVQEWRIAAGLFVDEKGEILKITETMVNQMEKAFPWAGCAARIRVERNSSIVDEKVDGQAYCLLPLGIHTGLPVHINGVFDLDESRKMLTSGDLRGGDENRVRWNQLLVKHCVSRAYAGLIKYLAKDVGTENIYKYYEYWPDPTQTLPPALSELITTVYQRLQNLKVLSSAAEEKWKTIRELVFLQKPEGKLLEALLVEKFPLPDPLLPSAIMDGFKQSGVTLQFITPKWIRDKYRVDQDLQSNIKDAPRASLKKRRWIEAFLQYCLSDNPGEDLKGLPLAIVCDGSLRTFGYFDTVAFFASDTERKIFAKQLNWFINPAFAKSCGLSPIPEVGLIEMTVDTVIVNLHAVVNANEDAILWNPDNSEYPNEEWLLTLYQYLTEKKTVGSEEDTLKSLPLVPDQFSKLWKMGAAYTPLIVPHDMNNDLLEALMYLGVPLVTGSDKLLQTIEDFERVFPGNFIWHITGVDLIDLLEANVKGWRDKAKVYDKKIHEPLLDFLSDERFVDKYGTSTIKQLKQLPILVTEDGMIVEPEHENIFISAGQTPPPVAGEICLVQTGPNDRWRKFILLLGIQELDRPVLIQRIITGYNQLSDSKKVDAFRWIRKNLEAAEEQLEKDQSRIDAENLRKLVAEAHLVICQEGELVPICRVYDPRVEIIQKVLGENAYLPDRDVYKQGERQWFEFFEKLGMAKSPRAIDILDYIDSLIDESEEDGADQVAFRVMAVFDHIRDNWGDLARQEVQDGYITHTMQSALHNRAWLPARRTEATLGQFPGHIIPENRLYKSSELHMPRNGHLIASQCPIALFTNKEPDKEIRDGLGFPDPPSPEDVVKHFKVLLSKWNAPDHSAIKESELETSLRAIYEFIGDHFKNESNTPFIQKLRDEFQNIPCVWDFFDTSKDGKRFWIPRHTFRDPIPYLRPFRIRIRHRSEREGRGFDALGRQDAPAEIDYFELLEDLLSTFSGQQVEPATAETVIYILEQMVPLLLDPDEDISDLPVLTRDGYIVEASDIYEFDAPWWEGKIEPDQIYLLDSRVPLKIREQAKIKQLSRHVTEKPLAFPSAVDLPEINEQCSTWQTTLRSSEFRKGLERIIKHNHPFVHFADPQLLGQLSAVMITPVERIQTQLILDDGSRAIGNNEGDYFYSEETSTFFVVARNEDDLDFVPEFLAQALNEQLSGYTLSDLSPLVKIIHLSPERIDATLTRLRIRQLTVQEATYSPKGEFSEEKTLETEAQTEPDNQAQGVSGDKTEKAEPAEKLISSAPKDETKDLPSKTSTTPKPSIPESPDETQTITPVHQPSRSISRKRAARRFISSSAGESSQPGHPTSAAPSEGRADDEKKAKNVFPSGEFDPDGVRRWPRMKQPYRSGQTHLTISRVFSKKHREKLERFESLDDESPHNIDVRDAAEKRVLDWEIQAGCAAERMPENNPGFDILSITPDGNTIKYIEVKGIDGPWTEDGVPLSPKQFDFGQKYEKSTGEEFWLYVVEYAKDDDLSKIYTISNPTSEVTQFRFDCGWREMDPNYEKPLKPAAGLKIQLEDGRIGNITQVVGQGSMFKLDISFEDGTEDRVKYQRSRMTLFQPEE